MKRGIWIGVVALLAFLGILLARLPASWVTGALPSNLSCAQLAGTIWNGTCTGIVWQGAALGDLKWRLRALPLLTGKIASSVEITGPAGNATADVEARSGNRLTARQLLASVALDPARLPSSPPNLRGQVATDLALLRIENGIVAAIEGRVDVTDLVRRDRSGAALGDYVITFPPATANNEPVGNLRSVAGPLDVEGTLRLTREPGFVLDGRVKPQSGASPELARELSGLGTPDAEGWRPFSVAGTF